MAEITIRISDKALKLSSVVFGAILVVWGLSHLLSSGVLEPKYQILMYVPDAEAVRVGAPVLLDGMSVGSISKVELASKSADSNRRIEVDLRIMKRFQDRTCLALLDSVAHEFAHLTPQFLNFLSVASVGSFAHLLTQ
jgi:hypothetical protein